jgi:hypothetical protein
MPENRGHQEDKSKAFSEELDRLLAGLPFKPGPSRDEDLSSTLQFAQKIKDVRSEPSPAFQAQLKARILQKLEAAEQKKKARSGWWRQLIPERPVWQAVAVVGVVLLAVGIIWASGVLRNQPSQIVSPPPVTTPVPGRYVQATASTNKADYAPGEEVDIQVSLKNISSESLTLPEFPPILSLMRTATQQPVYTFAAGSASRTLAPGGTASYALAWNQLGFDGQRVASGDYSVELEDIDVQGQAIKLTLAKPVQFRIGNPVVGRTLEDNLNSEYRVENSRPLVNDGRSTNMIDLLISLPDLPKNNM